MKPNTVMMGFYDNSTPEDLLKNRLFPKKRRLLNYHSTSSSNGNIVNFSNSLPNIQFPGKIKF